MTTTAKAHGMDGRLVDADWPPLALAEVRALLRGFPQCGTAKRILTVSPRPFSAASVVATSQGRVFVKRHPSAVRDREGLLEEHRFLRHLHAHRAPVPRIFSNASGETAIVSGDWTYEVHEAPVGVDLYEDALSWTPFFAASHARSAGRALARLHLAAQGFDAPPRRPRPLVASFAIFAEADPASAMRRYIDARPVLEEYLLDRSACDDALDLLAPFHAELLPLLPALPPLWTHNDLHASNILWSDATENAQAAAIIDFGLSDRTNAVHDLAHAIERNIVEWLALTDDPAHDNSVPVHLDHLRALLDGYEELRPLTEDEAVALAPMTALCHAEFALSETDYFLDVLRDENKAPAACEGWLVGHARWFRSSAGKKLLDEIRRWAATRKQTRKKVGIA